MFVSRCGAGEGPGGSGFQGFLSFDIFFFPPPPQPSFFLFSCRSGGERGRRGRVVGLGLPLWQQGGGQGEQAHSSHRGKAGGEARRSLGL